MIKSKFIEKNGVPYFDINGEELPVAAYITYFEERNDYKRFTDAGFRIFSVTVSLSARPINTRSGFMPFLTGVFDEKGKPDFFGVDKSVRDIINICPNAYIFPRIYLCMPKWWCDENPDECIMTPKDGMRECLYSDKFREDGGIMLAELIAHINASDYADNILGYQISGGDTQEWLHLDGRNGSFGDVALPYFNRYLAENYPNVKQLEKMPDRLFDDDGYIRDDYMLKYSDFSNESIADTVDYFCKVTKEMTGYKQIVGTFFGYTLEVMNPYEGSLALNKIIDSPNIDFFSSPNSYIRARKLGIDWGDMMPVDSVKLHGKVCFLECDIRTHLSRSPGASRKGSDPDNYYSDAVWIGPESDELSVMALRKCYARQISHRHAFWWFDMFGGWYDTDALLAECKRSLELVENYKDRTLDMPVELAVFLDEGAYKYVKLYGDAAEAVRELRASLAASGIPFHVYLIDDFERLVKSGFKYKAALFACMPNTEKIKSAVEYCDKNDIFYYKFTDGKYYFTGAEWREIFKPAGVHCYIEDGEDVLYVGAGLLCLHANERGEKTLFLPRRVYVKPAFSDEAPIYTDTVRFSADRYETKLFEIFE